MARNRRYEYLLWDVDGTLLDFEYSMRVSLCRCLEKIGVEPTEEMIACYSRINDGWWKRLEKGQVTKSQLLTGRFTDFFEACGIQCDDVAGFIASYQQSLGSVYRYMEDSLEICRKLKDMGYRQYTVTNGVTATQENKLKLSGFARIFNGNFISEQIGTAKPGKKFFEACFAGISEEHEEFDKSRALIIGDSLSSDIRGGENAGIDTCWYRPVAEDTDSDPVRAGLPVPTYEIRSLQEIFEIV